MEQKPPIPENEKERLAALSQYEIMNDVTLPEADFDELAKLASYICEVPMAIVSLIDGTHQWYKARVGLDGTEVARELSFCQYAIMGSGVMEVPDAHKDRRFKDNPFVLGAPHVRFYAGVPLENSEGFNLGTLCVIDSVPKQLTEAQVKALETLARQAMINIEMRQKNSALHRENTLTLQNMVAKDTFLANMSHEIRTPMNAIIGFTDILRKTQLNAQQQECVDSIHMAGKNLLSIINDILDFSKIESGRITTESIAFNPATLLRGVFSLFRAGAAEKQLGYKLMLDSGLPEEITGDPVHLTQIMTNLIGNALKFTGKGEIVVSVEAQPGETGRHTLRFTVSDTGIGIQPDKIERIFERFTQENNDTTRKFGGTGLGLSIARSLIEFHGGKLEVQSQPGEGTTFTFGITFREAGPNDVKAAQPADSVPLSGIRPLRILVCEDNMLNQRLLKNVLEGFGFEMELAGNGLEAIGLLKEKRFDVILMDLQMPEMDGYQATSLIRNDMQLTTPIIALTAHLLAGEREKCLSLGADAYLGKPFNQDELLQTILELSKKNTDEPAIAPEHTLQGLDLSYLKELSGGNTAFEQKMLELFLSEVQENVKDLEEAFQKQDAAGISFVAHTLKSSVQLVGYSNLLPMIYSLEALKTRDRISVEDRRHFQFLVQQLQRGFEEIEELIATQYS